MGEIPKNLKYSKEHEWAKVEGKVATIGVTAFAQEQLGDVVYVELPKVGEQLKAGDTFGVVESTKAVSDLYSPVSGTIVEVNDPVTDSPETVNTDPYGAAWLIKVEMSNPDEAGNLLDPDAYEQLCKSA
ncbi:MAG: glycine cleavage system protein GcvH [Myxococcales bacterium]